MANQPNTLFNIVGDIDAIPGGAKDALHHALGFTIRVNDKNRGIRHGPQSYARRWRPGASRVAFAVAALIARSSHPTDTLAMVCMNDGYRSVRPDLDSPVLASATPAWRVRIFGISWLAYFSYYFTRKNFSVVKSSLGLSLSALQWIDFAYLTGYMVGQFASGALGEILGPRLLVTLGMLASAVLTVLFAFADSLLTQVVIAYLVISALNGLVQASGWPGNARLMASWFSNARRAQIMGAWSTC